MKKTPLLIIILLSFYITPIASAFTVKGPVKTLDVPAYRVRGARYLPLILVCDAYGIDWTWDPVLKSASLKNGKREVRLIVGEYKAYTNGIIDVQERPVVFHKGVVCIPSGFLKTVFNKFFSVVSTGPFPASGKGQRTWQPSAASPYGIKRIVLDAGHGGRDPGAIGRDGIKERYITLDITEKVKGLLEAEDIEIILTRYNNTFIPLERRSEIANQEDVDLFISIHANASKSRLLKGFEVYYLSEAIDDNQRALSAAKNATLQIDKGSIYNRTKSLDAILWDLELTEDRRSSIELAKCILSKVDSKRQRLRGAKFHVLKGARMPAVLVEVGYISNRDECAKLGGRKYRTRVAQQITEGVLEYKRRFENSGGFTY